jgi:hypothetical protein
MINKINLFKKIHTKLFDEFLLGEDFDDKFKKGIDNSYLIFTGQRTYPEIMADEGTDTFFFFEPDITPSKEDILDLIYIYEEYEEYEKCGELLNLLNGFRKKFHKGA